MNKRLLSFIVVLAVFLALGMSHPGFAQNDDPWSVSATNWMQYWHHAVITGDSLTDFSHSREDSLDNRFVMDFNFGNFYAGGWFRVFQPLRPDTSYEKLTQRYFGWSDRGVTVHVGNFYQVFDRGLTLNTFYDDVVHSDDNLDGVKVSGLYDRFEFDALSARALEYTGAGIFGDKRVYTIRAVRGAGKPLKPVKLGFSYVLFKQNDLFDLNKADNVNITSFNSGINHGPFDLYGEYAYKRGRDGIGLTSNGDGTYFSGSFSHKIFSVYAEYKNFYNLLYPSPAGPFNLPPPASHSGRSLAVIAAAPGERGYQVGTLISPSYNLNFEFASSESFARGIPSTMVIGDPRNYFGEKYAGLRWSPISKMTLNYHWDRFDITARSHDIVGATDVNEIENYIDGYFYVTQTQTISVTTYTHRYVPKYNADNPLLTDYHDDYLTLGFAQGGLFQVNVGGSLSNKFRGINANDPLREPKRIGFVETLIHFGAHDLTVFYGRERGGLVCSSGICSYRPPFNGGRIMLFSRF